jgi:hypothetical protein
LSRWFVFSATVAALVAGSFPMRPVTVEAKGVGPAVRQLKSERALDNQPSQRKPARVSGPKLANPAGVAAAKETVRRRVAAANTQGQPAPARAGGSLDSKPAAAQPASPRSPAGSGPRAVVMAGGGGNGMTASDNASPLDPPDATGAAGLGGKAADSSRPTIYIEMVNALVATYSTTGSMTRQAGPVPLDQFMGVSRCDVGDPQIQWDPVSGRWYYAAHVLKACSATSVAGLDGNGLLYGWSTTNTDPSRLSGWCSFKIATGTLLDDYPKLGHSDHRVIIGYNVYSGADLNHLDGGEVTSFPKPATGDNTCTPPQTMATASGPGTFTPVPANTFVSTAGPGYVVGTSIDPTNPSSCAGSLLLWQVDDVTGVLAAPLTLRVDPYDCPAQAPQPGRYQPFDTLDARLTQAVALKDPSRGNQLAIWTQHTIYDPAVPSAGAIARWYEIVPSASPAPVQQQGYVWGGPKSWTFNAAISPSVGGDDAVINYNIVYTNTDGSSSLVELHAASRRSWDPADQMGFFTAVATSMAPDDSYSCLPRYQGPPCRWGDYAGASPDPTRPNLVWGSNQVNGPLPTQPNSPQWLTANFAISTVTGGKYHPVAPGRILDTRTALGGHPGPLQRTMDVRVAGATADDGTQPVPGSGADAVVLNVTITDPTDSGFLTVYPRGTAMPKASNLNFSAGQTIANLVEVPLGTNGYVTVFANNGSPNVIFDVAGWVSHPLVTGVGGVYHGTVPGRILDTRTSTGGHPSPLRGGQPVTLQVSGAVDGDGRTPVPSGSGAVAVVLNLTATNTTGNSFLTVYPAGSTRPNASNVNWAAGQTVPNRVTVQLPSSGAVTISNFDGNADVVVDVNGYYTSDSNQATPNGLYTPLQPTRILDTRTSTGGHQYPLGPAPQRPETMRLQVAGIAGVPATATAVVLNVTVTDVSHSSFLTVYPSDTSRPWISDLNYPAGDVVPNLVVVKLAPDGSIAIYNNEGSVDVVADVEGWYS